MLQPVYIDQGCKIQTNLSLGSYSPYNLVFVDWNNGNTEREHHNEQQKNGRCEHLRDNRINKREESRNHLNLNIHWDYNNSDGSSIEYYDLSGLDKRTIRIQTYK